MVTIFKMAIGEEMVHITLVNIHIVGVGLLGRTGGDFIKRKNLFGKN